jgi:hypothetical protein
VRVTKSIESASVTGLFGSQETSASLHSLAFAVLALYTPSMSTCHPCITTGVGQALLVTGHASWLQHTTALTLATGDIMSNRRCQRMIKPSPAATNLGVFHEVRLDLKS